MPSYPTPNAQAALEAAKSKPLPKIAEPYHLPEMKLLVAILAELQAVAGDKPISLTYRDAAALLGVELRRASKFMNRLRADDTIILVSKGTHHTPNKYLVER